jgi:hypothetical protein
MENQTQEKRFINKSFDKFKNRTDTDWIDPLATKILEQNGTLGSGKCSPAMVKIYIHLR